MKIKGMPVTRAAEQQVHYVRGSVLTRKWIYWHEPTAWYHQAGVGWLPMLHQLSMTPGVNGVVGNPDTNIADATGSILALTNAQANVILPYDKRLREQYRPYYVEYDMIEGSGSRGKVGKSYQSLFHEVEQLGNKFIWSRDDDGWHGFLDSLVADGVVAPMSDTAMRLFLDVYDARIQRHADRSQNPEERTLTEQMRAQRAVMVSDFDRQFGDVEPQVVDSRPADTPAQKAAKLLASLDPATLAALQAIGQAPEPTPVAPVVADFNPTMDMQKTELVAMATALGLNTQGTKKTLVKRITDARAVVAPASTE